MSNSTNLSSSPVELVSQLSMFERTFKFYFLLLLHIPSLGCTIFTVYHFKWKQLVTQILGILLIVNTLLILMELPFTLTYLHDGLVHNERICPVWILINYTLFILSAILIAWASIERYFFIYHEHWMTHHPVLLHYLPIGIFTIYTPSFYVGLVVFYPCQQEYTPYSYICGGPCYLLQLVPSMIDWGINVAFVMLLTCSVDLTLILRNTRQRNRMRKSIITAGSRRQWRRTVKLSGQIFSISILGVLGWVPYGIVSLLATFANVDFLSYLLAEFFIYFPYIQTLFLPYACLLFMPEIKQTLLRKLAALFLVKMHSNQVHVLTVHT